MDFGISQEGFCYARFGAEKHGFAVRSAAMRHRMHPLLSAPTGGSSHYRARGRYLWRKEARLCRAECPPHFLFVLPKRKRAGHGTKEKALRDELPGKAVNSPKTGTGRHELPTELETPLPAALYLNLKSVRRRICGHGAQRGANRTPSASLSAAAPPSPRGVSKGEGSCPRPPSPWGLVSKGGGQGPRPLCRFKGVRGEIEIPPRFSLGGRGGILFSKENIPLGFSSRKPGLPFVGAKKMWGTFCTEKPCYPCTA